MEPYAANLRARIDTQTALMQVLETNSLAWIAMGLERHQTIMRYLDVMPSLRAMCDYEPTSVISVLG